MILTLHVKLFGALGMAEPVWYTWLKKQQMFVMMGLYFMNNMMTGRTKTGAFEVYLDGESMLHIHVCA